MPPRATINQILQIGSEGGTPGTPVPATVAMSATMIEMGPRVNVQRYRASGNKFPTVSAMNQEWVEATLTGPLTYSEIVYWLSSVIDTVTPVTATGETTWTFVPTTSGADSPTIYTMEHGSAVRASEFSFGLLTGLTLRFNRQEVTFDAPVIGRAMTDGITLTPALSAIALVPVTSAQVKVYLDTTAAGLGGTELVGDFSVEWSLNNRYGPVWDLNGQTYFQDYVELEPEITVRLLLEANAANMALLTAMRADATRFLRVEATGATITTNPYLFTLDTAIRITEDPGNFQDNDGVYALEWSARAFHDLTWGKAMEIVVVNEVAAL